MIEAGQFLDDARIYTIPSKHKGGGSTHPVFATFIEDSSQIDLETGGYYYQPPREEVGTDCPLCTKRVTIYLLDAVSVTGDCITQTYCENCDLLFRSRMIGHLDYYGNFTAEENIK